MDDLQSYRDGAPCLVFLGLSLLAPSQDPEGHVQLGQNCVSMSSAKMIFASRPEMEAVWLGGQSMAHPTSSSKTRLAGSDEDSAAIMPGLS